MSAPLNDLALDAAFAVWRKDFGTERHNLEAAIREYLRVDRGAPPISCLIVLHAIPDAWGVDICRFLWYVAWRFTKYHKAEMD